MGLKSEGLQSQWTHQVIPTKVGFCGLLFEKYFLKNMGEQTITEQTIGQPQQLINEQTKDWV